MNLKKGQLEHLNFEFNFKNKTIICKLGTKSNYKSLDVDATFNQSILNNNEHFDKLIIKCNLRIDSFEKSASSQTYEKMTFSLIRGSFYN